MSQPICPICGCGLDVIIQPALVPGKSPITLVTCWNKCCPMYAFTLSEWQHARDSETKRAEIVTRWSFEQCVAKPVSVTLHTALALMSAGMRQRYSLARLARQEREFRAVCRDEKLLLELDRLMADYTVSTRF